LSGESVEKERGRGWWKYFFKKAKKYLLVEKKAVLLQPPKEGKRRERGIKDVQIDILGLVSGAAGRNF
jgi:hypothetical protein